MARQHLSVRCGSKGILLLESWLIDVETSKGRVRGSRTPAPVHPDTHVRARQAFDFHNALAGGAWREAMTSASLATGLLLFSHLERNQPVDFALHGAEPLCEGEVGIRSCPSARLDFSPYNAQLARVWSK